MKIPENVKSAFHSALKSRRVALGTASKSGIPNAVPIGLGKFLDDETMVLVDNYFLKTRMNLEENPVLALSFWVTEERDGKAITSEGYQLKGTAHFEDSGPTFERMRTDVKAIRADFPVRAVVIFKVTDIFDVKAGPNAGKRIA
ncbi:MAG TPA: pyridoxamine 5'-phosphate oxidase family protein [Candidatus Methanomethylicus sp.]|nr:pyridoxamine 5'-phosphate oxidase family protein [Candidatus Methanomethylicus sp.]HRR54597.1 pyridoxamine 5'-phosphate oxidase family protein [Candidatus Methanomethylicus sp.]HRU82106.1 pyridoxamine 5'-phosphate oxidase family protein [Candidatus Methanomethylicus sp.]